MKKIIVSFIGLLIIILVVVGIFMNKGKDNSKNNLTKITIQSIITEEAINLKVKLAVPVHNKTQTFGMNRITTNLNGIPAIESELVTA